MNRLVSISKKLDTCFKVVQKLILITLAVAVLVCAALTIANAINPNAIIGSAFNNIDIGPITIELAQELAPDNGTILTYVGIVIILGAVSALLLYYAVGLVRKILKPMTEGRPFDSGVGHSIKKLAYVSITLGIAYNIGAMLQTAAAVKAFDLAVLSGSDAIRSITANYTLDLNFLIVFFVLLLVSHVFNYGAELQQLSDETL